MTRPFLLLIALFSTLLFILSSVIPASEPDLTNLLLDRRDPSYGGYYLDIEYAMNSLGVSRLFAHEIQNQMRDELESVSGSYSSLRQKAYLNDVIANAVDNVTHRYREEGMFKPLELKKNEFILVFSLEDTLVAQWHQRGRGNGAKREGDLTVSIPDSVPYLIDPQNGNSLPKPRLQLSSTSVQTRPGFKTFIRKILKVPGFMGFVIFTGKEDHAAWSLFRAWKKLKPELFYHLLGFYTRNYFRFDQNLSQPAKDLRIFDPSLKHILSIDHNERWVLQPHLNFKIPGFGADSYLNSLKNMRHQRAIHRGLLPFVANQIENCALKVIQGGYGRQIHYCFQAKLGTLSSTAGSELFLYSETIKNRMRLDPTSILQFFHQETHIEKQRILSAPFVQYQNFKEVRLPRSSKLPKNPN